MGKNIPKTILLLLDDAGDIVLNGDGEPSMEVVKDDIDAAVKELRSRFNDSAYNDGEFDDHVVVSYNVGAQYVSNPSWVPVR